MSLDWALRTSEVLLAWAFLQQALEHLPAAAGERWLMFARMPFALGLMFGVAPLVCASGLLLVAVAALVRFDGPYNGGADRMGCLILFCLWCARLAPSLYWCEVALGYLAVQLCLSYAWSGWVKLANPQWRSGRALLDVFAWSAYPVSVDVRRWQARPRLLLVLAWAVLLFELAFPFALMSRVALALTLALAAVFHLANAWLFGLNRFVWVWIAGYPVLLWFQSHLAAVFAR